eukprot:361935-Chlamydomonas_euryale.AAC.24
MCAQVQIVRSKADPSCMPPYARVSDAVRASFRLNGLRGPFQVRATSYLWTGGGVHVFVQSGMKRSGHWRRVCEASARDGGQSNLYHTGLSCESHPSAAKCSQALH